MEGKLKMKENGYFSPVIKNVQIKTFFLFFFGNDCYRRFDGKKLKTQEQTRKCFNSFSVLEIHNTVF